jgi:mycothiol synthase
LGVELMQQLPAGYTLRAPTLTDAEAVVALVNAASLADAGYERSSLQRTLMHWRDPQRNLDDDWLVIAPDGEPAAFLELYEFPPYTVFEFDGVVHPAHRRRGIGTFLLRTIEARARRGMERSPQDERIILETEASSENVNAHHLLLANGFQHVRDWKQMLITMDAPPPLPVWADGVRVRRFVPGQDDRAIWETAEAAWQDHHGYAPTPFEEFRYFRIESQANFDPSLWLLAEAGDQVVGVLLGLPDRPGYPDAGWVSLLGVRREWRGRGIARALLHETFGEFWRRGVRQVGLNVDASSLTGANRLYERAGMREVRRDHTYEKVIRDAGGEVRDAGLGERST